MSSTVFADTLYWVAVLNPRDQWHLPAVEMRRMLDDTKIITTETVLVELLNYFAESGPYPRNAAVLMVRSIVEDEDVTFLPTRPDTFTNAVSFYAARPDKGYSA